MPRTSTRAGSPSSAPTSSRAPRARSSRARSASTDEFERERERRGAEARIEPSRNVLAALCESVIGAAFLHYGYRETADAVIEAFRERIEYAEQGFVDHKTELQERLARQGASVSYRLMEATGPAHRRSFTSAAMLGDERHRHGRGPFQEGLGAGCRPGGAAARRQRGPAVHLSAIRLRGFKSFREPLELRFESGVSVVVGPNGSGKSNIADALQWAMASQPPSQLRAQTGQDVLFAGSEQHAASGVCEVELVLDNSDGRVGVPRSELSVMRRLDRSGDSDYLLNRQSVRRLDVRDLLAEAGLGRELHCIIAQGTVDQVLLARPDERRGLVEEAAGLGKFKRRRQRAEAKLARVAADLERAGDVERELRARLRPLELQATAAERAEALGRQIAEVRLRLLASALAETRRARGERESELVGGARTSATRRPHASPRSPRAAREAEERARAHPRRAGGGGRARHRPRDGRRAPRLAPRRARAAPGRRRGRGGARARARRAARGRGRSARRCRRRPRSRPPSA